MKGIVQILLILIISIFLTGCKKGAKEIKATEIFTQKEDSYFVYFYKPGCSACENLKPRLNEYISFAKGKSLPKVYKMNVLNMPNLNAPDNWKEVIVGKTSIMEITIGTTPTLLLIEEKEVAKVFAGRTNIENELDRLQEG